MVIQSVLYQLGAINNVYCFFVLLDEQGSETSDCSALIVLFCTFSNSSLFVATIAGLMMLFGAKHCLEELWTHMLSI